MYYRWQRKIFSQIHNSNTKPQLEVRTYFNIVDRIDTSKFDKYIPNKRDYINGKYLTNYGAIIFGKLLIDFGEITEEKIIKTTRDVLSKYTDENRF